MRLNSYRFSIVMGLTGGILVVSLLLSIRFLIDIPAFKFLDYERLFIFIVTSFPSIFIILFSLLLKTKFPNNWGKIKDRFYCILLAMIGYEMGFFLVEGGFIMILYSFLYPLLGIVDIYWIGDIFKIYKEILYVNLIMAMIVAYLTTKDSKNLLERILIGIAVLYLILGAGIYVIGIGG